MKWSEVKWSEVNIVYSQSPLGYTRFLTSRIKSVDILEPTRPETFSSSQLFEFAVYSDRAGVASQW